MKREELRNDIVVCHTKHQRNYKVVSANCRYKDSVKGWVDAVCYAPLYPNEHEMFMRGLDSFFEEFEADPNNENELDIDIDNYKRGCQETTEKSVEYWLENLRRIVRTIKSDGDVSITGEIIKYKKRMEEE